MTYAANPPLGRLLMLHALCKNWWLILLRGIAAIIFGVLTFIWPGITLLTLDDRFLESCHKRGIHLWF
jgi:uncharacterized membrane protein HdeD (DUF308 family)